MKKKQSNFSNEEDINKVLKYQEKELNNIKDIDKKQLNETISDSENLLKELGYSVSNNISPIIYKEKKDIIIPTWEEICIEASKEVKENVSIQDLFTEEELSANEIALKNLNNEFKSLYKLDNIDITICVFAGLLSSVIDILLVGIPHKTPEGLKGGTLSNYIRNWFEKKFPEVDMEKLANSKISKVPFDAQDNRNTVVNVDGLSTYYHRLLSLGHDPFLGLLFGVSDILNGTMTTIDKKGKFVKQTIKEYADRKEDDIFKAITKQIIHFKSDITTSMGLPAPLMGLFDLFQFGEIGEEKQTIAQIVQGMYYEGYDFIQFCASSIPTMLIEVIVRICYSLKKINEGETINNSIPFSLDRTKMPKLQTMLFISHSIACSVNAGKIYFKKNPMAINYSEWITFAKYSFMQLRWALLKKPQLKDKYINNKLLGNLNEIYKEINDTYNEYDEKYNIIME